MLQACPEIHGNGPDLNLYFRRIDPIGGLYRNRDQHVIAAVSALLWMLHIIFDIKNRKFFLLSNHLCQTIDIGCKGAHDTHTCNIIDMLHHVFHGIFQPVPA